jgi:1-acyl-sn-glycerol-3-phosphate acyltransferase
MLLLITFVNSTMHFQLYRLSRYFFQLALRFFFRRIEVKGLERVPMEGPVIIVANHAASFLDPIVIAAKLKVPVYFIAKARALKRPVPTWFLKLFNVIPVYRSQDDPTLMDKNQTSFEACYKHLEMRGNILIFPEGISHSIRHLLKIKTGAARMALGAEARNKFNLGLKIIAFGMNYSNQEKFQSRLFVSVSEPINVIEFKDVYLQEEVEGVNRLTEKIENSINQSIINAGDERIDTLINRIERLMKARILKDWGVKKEILEQDHNVTKRIMQAMDYFLERDQARFSKMENEINQYFELLKDVDLPETIFKSKKLTPQAVLFYISYFIPGLLFFIPGLVGNFIPYKLSILSARGWSRNKEYRGAAGFLAGILIFIFFYCLEFMMLKDFTKSLWIPIVSIIAMPFLGIFTFYYWRKLSRFYCKIIFTFSKRQIFIRRLLARRNSIIRELEFARQEFLEAERNRPAL